MKTLEGFSQADSTNLPSVETWMMMEYTSASDKHYPAQIRGAKSLLSSRTSDVNNKAVGYVEVKRDAGKCNAELFRNRGSARS
jgi:hypothetical protein